jgi:hypothetical protein
MIVTKKWVPLLGNDRKLLALFGGMVFDGIVFVSLMIAIAILYFM